MGSKMFFVIIGEGNLEEGDRPHVQIASTARTGQNLSERPQKILA